MVVVDDDLRGGDALLRTAPFAVGEHGVVDALRPAGGDDARRLVHAIDLAHLFSVQHLADHGQHFGLELRAARAQVALQQVDEREQPEDLIQKGVMLQAAVIHGAGALAAQPSLVLLGGHVGQLFQDLFFVPPLLGQPLVDLEELVVRVHVPKQIEGFLFARHRFLISGSEAPLIFAGSGLVHRMQDRPDLLPGGREVPVHLVVNGAVLRIRARRRGRT